MAYRLSKSVRTIQYRLVDLFEALKDCQPD
jgi:hypothetical protein